MWLARREARRRYLRHRDLQSLDDWEGLAYESLCRAANDFTHNRNVSFGSFVTFRIRARFIDFTRRYNQYSRKYRVGKVNWIEFDILKHDQPTYETAEDMILYNERIIELMRIKDGTKVKRAKRGDYKPRGKE